MRQNHRGKKLVIALINNMPDAALEDTERQFSQLLGAASGDLRIHLVLSSLPGISRKERAQQRISERYVTIEELCNTKLDAVIVTGTEPHTDNLKNEPYWNALVEVIEWAAKNTRSTVLSCLAAHAGVLYCDGIPRHRLQDKKFGVFNCERMSAHTLTTGLSEPVHFPHSRWNEIREKDLAECGYEVLTASAEAGVDSFTKRRKKCLFLYFQGHPEYDAHSLFREYRRDIRRFLECERETYPSLPRQYFDDEAVNLLKDFQRAALLNRHVAHMESFPATAVSESLTRSWCISGASFYRNWLQYIVWSEARATSAITVPRILSPGSAPAQRLAGTR